MYSQIEEDVEIEDDEEANLRRERNRNRRMANRQNLGWGNGRPNHAAWGAHDSDDEAHQGGWGWEERDDTDNHF